MDKYLNLLINAADKINGSDKIIANTLTRKLKEESIYISFEQFTILNNLWNEDSLSQCKLAQLTNRDQASTSRLINTLIKNELIIRQCCSSDKRINRIKLTDKGRLLKEPVLKIVKECLEDAVKGMTEEEIKVGIQFLEKIQNNLIKKCTGGEKK
ncbi:MarR family winged helix-turn-helix transcriptional regulator [Clostridium sp.]|uniref:MarR family winged helix-turn-helix transcriptional regulator n=1 Tax=Clostridium sp. TaxID=1506 RepID=UPI002FC76E91